MTCYINVMLVLQSCNDSLYILPGSSSETNATSSDCAFHVGNVKVEEDLDMQEEKEEVNVKTEIDIGSEEEKCMGIKVEEGTYSEEEGEEKKDIYTKEEEHLDIKEEFVDIKEEFVDIKEEFVDIKEEVSIEDTV